MIRFLATVGLLTLVYALVLGSLNPWDLALGAAMAAGLVLRFRRFALGSHPESFSISLTRVLAFVPFVGATLWDVMVGAWTVLGITLHLRPLRSPGILEIPIEASTPSGVVVSAFAVTVSPGTYLLDMDLEQKVMRIHALDASDPDAVRAHYHHLYERYQRKVFP